MLFCDTCQQHTITSGPVCLRRIDNIKMHVTGVCSTCNDTCSKMLSPVEMRMLPLSFKQMPFKKTSLSMLKLVEIQ